MSPELKQNLATHPRVVVVFSSPWCGPCRALEAQLDGVLPTHPSLKAVHVDVSVDPASAQAFSVRATPTLLGIVDGRVIAQHTGNPSPRALQKFLRGIQQTEGAAK